MSGTTKGQAKREVLLHSKLILKLLSLGYCRRTIWQQLTAVKKITVSEKHFGRHVKDLKQTATVASCSNTPLQTQVSQLNTTSTLSPQQEGVQFVVSAHQEDKPDAEHNSGLSSPIDETPDIYTPSRMDPKSGKLIGAKNV